MADLARLTQAAELAAYNPDTPGEELVNEAKGALEALQKETG